jgi:hypothetical protein
VYFHSWVEWSLATFSAEYLFAMSMGLVAANARQLGYWRTTRPRKVAETHKVASQPIFQQKIAEP